MRDLTSVALDVAKKLGASYADIRVVDKKQESVRTRNGNVESLGSSRSKGFGVRVLYDGAWGFSSSARITEDEVRRVAEEAVSIAKASATVKREKDVELAPVKPVTAKWKSECKIDPFSVKAEDKIALLLEADRLMRQNKGVRVASGNISSLREDKVFASTEAARNRSRPNRAGIDAWPAGRPREVLSTSAGGDFASRGWEFVEDALWTTPARGQRRALLTAKQCPQVVTDLVLVVLRHCRSTVLWTSIGPTACSGRKPVTQDGFPPRNKGRSSTVRLT